MCEILCFVEDTYNFLHNFTHNFAASNIKTFVNQFVEDPLSPYQNHVKRLLINCPLHGIIQKFATVPLLFETAEYVSM